jgi:hypothetical protein
VNDRVQPPPLSQESEALGVDIAGMQAEVDRIIQLAGIKNDPTLPYLKVVSLSLGLQWRLHDQAVSYFHDASQRLDRQLADTISQGEQALEVRRASIVDQLAPRLTAVVEQTTRQNLQTARLRTILGGAAALIAVLVAGGSLTYASGYASGRTQGEVIGHTINSAMALGPNTAAAWSLLMVDNDPVRALAACRKNIATSADGRHSCSLPVWLDTPPAPAS